MAEYDEKKLRAAWDKSPDLQAEFFGKFESYLGYMKAEAEGRVKVCMTLQQKQDGV